MKFQFIAEHSQQYSITLLCQALEVFESGYYAWKNREVSQHCREEARLSAEIQQIFLEHRGCLWQPTHSRRAPGTRQSLLTQAGDAIDAAVGLVSAVAAVAAARKPTRHERSSRSLCAQSSQSTVQCRGAQQQVGD